MKMLLALALLLAPTALAAGGPSCSCHNLKSLQQETENAAYEARFFLDMANELKAIEDHQRDLNENHPTDSEAGKSVITVSGQARERMMAEDFHLPHPQVEDYAGPTSVALVYGTCTNKPADLDGLANGAPCKEIGTITLEHEARHRAICETMGANRYWARLPSELALEEADRYQEQATAMRALLKYVIDGSTVEIESEMAPVLEGHGMRVVYKYVMKRSKLEGKSSPGSDRWTFEGRSERVGTIQSFKMPGMTCKPSGQFNDAITLSLGLDGFTMDLDMTSKSLAGDVALKCSVPGAGSGMGQSLRPMSEGGSGTVFTGLPVQLETRQVLNIADGPIGQVMAGSGMSISGEEITTVTISCPGP